MNEKRTFTDSLTISQNKYQKYERKQRINVPSSFEIYNHWDLQLRNDNLNLLSIHYQSAAVF